LIVIKRRSTLSWSCQAQAPVEETRAGRRWHPASRARQHCWTSQQWRRFSRPKLGNLRRIAIDEISIAKGRRFWTLVLDLEGGEVVFVGEGRSSET